MSSKTNKRSHPQGTVIAADDLLPLRHRVQRWLESGRTVSLLVDERIAYQLVPVMYQANPTLTKHNRDLGWRGSLNRVHFFDDTAFQIVLFKRAHWWERWDLFVTELMQTTTAFPIVMEWAEQTTHTA